MSTPSTSPTTIPYPLVYANPPVIKLAVCYNPFLPHDLAQSELAYNQHHTLADYMVGLPDEVKWSVAYQGEAVDESQWALIKPQPSSIITIVRVPEGGGHGGGKSILRMVALLAVAAFAAWAAPALIGLTGLTGAAATMATAIATSAITMAGAMVVNALLPAQQINPNSGPQSTSYSIDGPKNTAREGVPVPVVYGEFQVGGNITDLFTRNVGDDQYLFMRTVLNDGPVAGISNVKLNGQDITNYKDVEYRVNLGNEGDEAVSWFHEAIQLINLNQKITTGGVLYTTSSDCDRVRVDVAFPMGLISHSSKSGNSYDETCQLSIEYRAMSADGTIPTGTGAWASMPLELELPLDTSGGSGIYSLPQTSSAKFTLAPAAPTSGTTWDIEAQYKLVTDSEWKSLGHKTGTYQNVTNYQGGFTFNTSLPNVQWNITFPKLADYQVRFIGGSVQDNTDSNANLNSSTKNNVPGTVNNLKVVRQTFDPFHLTFQSATLPHGRYQVRVKRATAEGANTTDNPSQCWVTDIGEVQNENVTYEGVAMLSLKIKLNDQLSSQPTLTCMVKGSLVNIYDDDGSVTDTRWSNNPADICMDILTHTERGGGYDLSKIIWPKVSEFREFCETNQLYFNGVFDFVTTLWDAMQSVARVGHGTLLPQGTRYTFTIDKATTPSMVFTGSNIYMDTFQKTWVNLDDRANEIQQEFYDATSDFRTRMVRLPNAEAQSRGDKVKAATVSGFGITSVEQATREAEYQARTNSYLTNFVSFDAPIEAVGLSIGDVAIVQHDSVKYADGVGGRLDVGSTDTVIKLDRPVTMTAGHTYSILITTDALQLYTVAASNIAGNKVTVSGLPAVGLPRIRRLTQGGNDREVMKIINLGGGSYVITVDDGAGLVVGNISLWDTDVIVERQVQYVAGDSTSVTLTAPLAAAPKIYSGFLFGQVSTVKQPYRLTSISSSDDLFKRTLSFANYDSRIYDDGSWGVPTLSQDIVSPFPHVTSLSAAWDKTPGALQQRIKVTVEWKRPADSGYGGADVYVQTNNGTWVPVGSVDNATKWSSDYNRDDLLAFKVVAYNKTGVRALFDTAPEVGVRLDTTDADVEPPSSVTATVTSFNVAATVRVAWLAPVIAATSYEVSTKQISEADYDTFLAAGSNVDSYPASVLSNTGYTVSKTTSDTKADLTNVSVARYVIRVRSLRGYAISEWAYASLYVEAPAMPTNVTNLKLSNASPAGSTTFASTDAHFTWDDIFAQQAAATGVAATGLVDYALDYKVEVRDTDNVLLRTEYTTSPNYTYSIAKNQADTDIVGVTARRAFKVAVAIRGKQGQISNAVTLAVSNPAPTTSGVDLIIGASQTSLRYDPPTDSDFRGIIVWAALETGFTPDDGTVVFKGTGTATFRTTDNAVYYYRYAFYDAFETQSLNISGEHYFTAGVTTDSTVPDGSIDIDKFVAGITAIEIVTVLPTSNNFVGRMVFLISDAKLYRYNGTDWSAAVSTADLTGVLTAAQIANNSLDVTKFSNTIRPVEILGALPTTGNTVGRTVFLTTDGKIYRYNGTSFVSSVPTTDLTGTINSAQLADASITTAKFAASLAPVETLGALPSTGNSLGRMVFLTTDGKLYRYTSTGWSAAVQAVDVLGTLSDSQIASLSAAKLSGQIIGSQIAAAAIDTTKFASTIKPVEIVTTLPTTGNVDGRTAYLTTDSKIYRYQAGSGWTAAVDGADISANSITAGKIAAGAISATEIAAGAITASKLFVGDSSNMIADADFADTAAWTLTNAYGVSGFDSSTVTTGTIGVPKVAFVTGNGTKVQANGRYCTQPPSQWSSIEGGKQYRVSADSFVTTGFTGRLRVVLDYYQADKVTASAITPNASVTDVDYRTAATTGNVLAALQSTVTAPADACFVRVSCYIDWSTTLNNAANGAIGGLRVARAMSGELIVDGAITAAKIAANTITANEIAAGTITANEIKAGTITATNIAAGAITATQLAANSVIAGKIQAGAVSTNELAANAVTASKVLIGDTSNMILNTDFSDLGYWDGRSPGVAVDPTPATANALLSPGTVRATATGATSAPTQYCTAISAGQQFTVEPGKTYRASSNIYHSNLFNGLCAIYIRFFAADGSITGTDAGPCASTDYRSVAATSAALEKVSGTFVAPVNAVKAGWYYAWIWPSAASVGNCWAGSPRVSLAITGELIVDGTITANEIAAGTITANQMAANSITAGKIAAGAVSADQITAGAITAAKLALTDTANLIQNNDFTDLTYWVKAAGHTIDANVTIQGLFGTANSIRQTGNGTTSQTTEATQTNTTYGRVGVEPGKPYRLSYRYYMQPGTTAIAQGRVVWYTAAGAVISTAGGLNSPDYRTTAAVGTQTGEVSIVYTAPSNAAFCIPQLLIYWSTTLANAGNVWVGNPRLTRAVNAELIVDGTITANEIAANTITAGNIKAGTITANEIAASTITGDKILAGTIQAAHISVTSLSAVSANLGSITGGALNIANKFIVSSAGAVTIQSATSGSRLVLTNSLLQVYDASNVLRVRLGIW